MFQVGLLSAFMKSFLVLFMLFLPIFYHEGSIDELGLWYLWAIMLTAMLIGSFLVAKWLQYMSSRKLLFIALWLFIIASVWLFFDFERLRTISYLMVWIGTGIGISAMSNIQYNFSQGKERFSKLANLSMFGDIMRISFPVIAWLIYKFLGVQAVLLFALLLWVCLLVFVYLSKSEYVTQQKEHAQSISLSQFAKNKGFVFSGFLEFFDSFSSSQLFVFLPLVLAYKWMAFENAVLLQAIIFLWYLCGRRTMWQIAKRSNGYLSVAIAEVGMAVVIVWIIWLNSLYLVIALCFLLGICTRGTSPVIKWIAFDQLKKEESSSGSAIHVFVGDSGSALGQLVFGFLFSVMGVYGPFWISSVVALILATACLLKARSYRSL